MRFGTASLLVALAWGVAGCGSNAEVPTDGATSSDGALFSCATETRAAPYMDGMQRMSKSATYVARLMTSQPSPPSKFANTWTVQITDGTGAPVDGLTITATPFMPDHNHGTSVKAVVTPAGSAGTYTVTPIYFFMPGYWEVTLALQPATGVADSVVFPMCIPG